MGIRLATWNVNSIRARQEVVKRWLAEESPDILCMQEIKVENGLFPFEVFREMGYYSSVNGQKTWNGVAILSRSEPVEVETDLPDGFLKEQKRVVTARFPGLTVVNVYVPNGGDVTLDRFAQKLEFLERLGSYASGLSGGGALVVAGDFNVAPEEDDVYDPVALDGRVCYHPEEKKRLRRLMEQGFTDVFRTFNPEGKAYSWWDYRAAAFRRGMGMRLDLVLLNQQALKRATSCEIHVGPRKWERPSDHAPVVLEMD